MGVSRDSKRFQSLTKSDDEKHRPVNLEYLLPRPGGGDRRD